MLDIFILILVLLLVHTALLKKIHNLRLFF
uniref:Uncharacterized protein n=1 Tax=Schistosoma japonicum TaxID=6182 RepID=Q5BYX3_SCHJA|nr:unknown [Schistosoma japonicum]